jgi:hypothetical protein
MNDAGWKEMTAECAVSSKLPAKNKNFWTIASPDYSVRRQAGEKIQQNFGGKMSEFRGPKFPTIHQGNLPTLGWKSSFTRGVVQTIIVGFASGIISS